MSLTQAGFWIPSDDQAKMTLRRMAHYVNESLVDHDFVWWTREQIQRLRPISVQSRDQVGIARGIREFVAAHLTFVPDPVGVEDITPPEKHMRLIQEHETILGDCDDAATLSAAMGKALGIPASFRILAFYKPDNPYQHVITYLHPRGGGAIDMDTTRPAQKLPPVATRSFEVKV